MPKARTSKDDKVNERGVPRDIRENLALDIVRKGGITEFDKGKSHALADILNNPERLCYPDKQSPPAQKDSELGIQPVEAINKRRLLLKGCAAYLH